MIRSHTIIVDCDPTQSNVNTILSIREAMFVGGIRYPADVNVSIMCSDVTRPSVKQVTADVIVNADDFRGVVDLFMKLGWVS